MSYLLLPKMRVGLYFKDIWRYKRETSQVGETRLNDVSSSRVATPRGFVIEYLFLSKFYGLV